jgi:hypothetical protein
MPGFSPITLARVHADRRGEVRDGLAEVARFAADQNYDWITAVGSVQGDYVRVRVGALDVFFREALGLDGLGFIQYGYYEQGTNAEIFNIVAGEWRYTEDSRYTDALRQRDGIRLVAEAIQAVLGRISEAHGTGARCWRGYVMLSESRPSSQNE